ncbi:hypothetical protein C2G38_341431 [Gigaspora rosea]|uniref:Cohesin loading factor-domain-containing protein n=1 Tax=Gigaspora rosea TaxID=44941 RepID=A0A397UEF1_9GLOM|nr:hypothetical protein C2G38_341431 [Gigaspora rosea]
MSQHRFPAQYEQWSTQQQWNYQQQQQTQYYQQQQQSFQQPQHSYQQPQYLSESQTNYEYMDYTPTPYDGHTTYTDPLHQLQMPQQQIPSEVTLQSMFPTQILPQTRERHFLHEQLISQYPQQQETQLLPHQLLWYFAELYLSKAKATELSSTSLVNCQKLSSEQQKNILSAIKCLEAVIISVANGSTYTPLVELKTRFRLSQILFWFTENVREAESHLQKAIMISQKLDAVAELKFRMIDLQCNIFKSANNVKAARNIMKSGVIEAMEWTQYARLDISLSIAAC